MNINTPNFEDYTQILKPNFEQGKSKHRTFVRVKSDLSFWPTIFEISILGEDRIRDIGGAPPGDEVYV